MKGEVSADNIVFFFVKGWRWGWGCYGEVGWGGGLVFVRWNRGGVEVI